MVPVPLLRERGKVPFPKEASGSPNEATGYSSCLFGSAAPSSPAPIRNEVPEVQIKDTTVKLGIKNVKRLSYVHVYPLCNSEVNGHFLEPRNIYQGYTHRCTCSFYFKHIRDATNNERCRDIRSKIFRYMNKCKLAE